MSFTIKDIARAVREAQRIAADTHLARGGHRIRRGCPCDRCRTATIRRILREAREEQAA